MIGLLTTSAVLPTLARSSGSQQHTPWNIRIETSSDVLYGTMGEYVFADPDVVSAPDSDLLSQLDWDMKPVVMAGVDLEIDFPYSITVGAGFAGALPMVSGKMVDRDWKAGYNLLDSDDPNSPTHYSEHTNYLLGGYIGEVFAGYQFSGDNWSTMPMLGFQAKYFSFEGRDGDGEYPDGEKSFVGTVITYRQFIRIPYIGVSGSYQFPSGLVLNARGRFSTLTNIDAIDHHRLTGREFYDVPRGGMFVSGELRASYPLTHSLHVWIEGGGDYIPQFRGDSFYVDTGEGKSGTVLSGGEAGGSLRLLRASVGVSLQALLFDN